MLKSVTKIFKRNEKGQGMVEFGLILALVSVVAIGSLSGLGGQVSDEFNEVFDAMGGSAVVKGNPIYSAEEIDHLISQGYTPISNAEELSGISRLNGKYIQVADIDLSGIDNFEPIGTSNNEFTGIFDGGGHTINNLTVDRGNEDYIGLFGYGQGSTLSNIGLENVNIKGGNNVGGLIGYQKGSSRVSHSYATGKVVGTGGNIGGLVGFQINSSISDSYTTTQLIGGNDRNVGGLVGHIDLSTVTQSHATGQVNGTKPNVGGLVGYNISSNINNSYATGNVTGVHSVGGLVGNQNKYTVHQSPSIINSYAIGKAYGEISAGGLIGSDSFGYNRGYPVINSGWANDVGTIGLVSTTRLGMGMKKSEIDEIIIDFIK